MKSNRELFWYVIGAVMGMIGLAFIIEHRKQPMDRLAHVLASFPRCRKLLELEQGKPFLVISITEPYFPEVYHRIRKSEIDSGTWGVSDELRFKDLMLRHDQWMEEETHESRGE